MNHKERDRELFEVVWTNCDVDAVARYYASSYVCHNPPQPDICGRDGIARHIERTHEAFANLRYMVEDQVCEGDKTLTRWTMIGTLLGSQACPRWS